MGRSRFGEEIKRSGQGKIKNWLAGCCFCDPTPPPPPAPRQICADVLPSFEGSGPGWQFCILSSPVNKLSLKSRTHSLNKPFHPPFPLLLYPNSIYSFMSLSLYFFLFRTTPAAHGNSQARGGIRVAAACLHHSHSNVGSLTY